MLKTRSWSVVLAAAAALILSACGGGAEFGGGTAGGTLGGTTGGTTGGDTPPQPAEVRLVVSSQQLPSNAVNPENGVAITAIVTDAAGRTLEGVTVDFGLSPSNGGALLVTQAQTDASGVASAVLTTGGDSSFPRQITVSARAGNLGSNEIQIAVVGPDALTVQLFASSTQLPSGASDVANGVTLTAVVKDSGQNVVEGVGVTFAITAGNGTLTPVRLTTDASGTAQVALTTGGDPTNREITVSASAAGETSSLRIAVVGTRLERLNASSDTVQAGTPSEFVFALLDSSNRGIAGRSVSFSAVNGAVSPAAATTDASGQVRVTFTPAAAATATLSAAALGVSRTVELRVSQDRFRVAFLDSNGSEIVVPDGTVLEIPTDAVATIRVTWTRGTSQTPVVNRSVTLTTTRGTFCQRNITTSCQPASTSQSTTTGAAGRAQFRLRSPQAGPARIVASGFDATPDPDSAPLSELQTEFVATTPASVNVQADPATIGVLQDSTIVATVRDAINNLVKNAIVDFSLDDVTGGRLSAARAVTDSQGQTSIVFTASSTPSALDGVKVTGRVFGAPPSVNGMAALTVGSQTARIVLGTGNEIVESEDTTRYELPYTAIVTDNAGNPAPNADLRLTLTPEYYMKGFYLPGGPPWVQLITAVCDNEDTNRNGILDPGEDINGNGILDPSNVGTVLSTPELDEQGIASFFVNYPQDRGNWVNVRLTARARVSGTEATEVARFTLPISAADAESDGGPPGFVSPYGAVGRCDLTDDQVAVIEFAADSRSAQVNEGASTTLRITASRRFREPVVIPLNVTTLAAGSRYTLPLRVTIPADATEATATFTATTNTDVGDSVELLITLGQPETQNAVIGPNATSVVTIVDVSSAPPPPPP